MVRARSFLQIFFWFAFAVFLATSIPHVAYFFHTFEPQDTDWSGVFWWSVSYFIAACIDVTIFLSSMTVASLQRRGSSKALIISVWVFIIGLACFSWFINYKYAIQFAHTSMLSATPVTIPWINITIPDIDPVLASSFQILAVVYTWISDKIAADEKVLTADELEKMADELQNVATQKARIAEIKRTSSVNRLKELMDAGKDVVSYAKNTLAKDTLPDETDDDTVFVSERTTDELDVIERDGSLPDNIGVSKNRQSPSSFTSSSEANADNLAAKESQKKQGSSGKNTTQNDFTQSSLDGLPTSGTVSIEEAARVLGCDVKYARELRSKHKLIATPRNKDRITVRSIHAVLESRQKRNQNSVKSTAKLAENDTAKQTQDEVQTDGQFEEDLEVLSGDKKLTLTIEALTQKPDITDEQLAFILGVDNSSKARFWRLKAKMVMQEQ